MGDRAARVLRHAAHHRGRRRFHHRLRAYYRIYRGMGLTPLRAVRRACWLAR